MQPKPLRQYRAKFERVRARERAIDPNNLGQRSKLGGKPDWIQLDDTPECPKCEETMYFVGQLDSIEHQSKDNPHSVQVLSGKQDFMFGDVGMIYVFFCFDCCQSKSVFQCG